MSVRKPGAAIAFALLATAACSKPQTTRPTPAPAPTPVAAPAPPRETPAQVVEKLRANFRRVQFAFDDAQLTGEGQALLRENARILKENPGVRVTIEGHTDHFGTSEYNLALGQRRAETAYRFLLDLGVPRERLQRTSLGEERPLVGAGDREAVAADRRAEFRVTAGADAATSSSDG
jgi:peptidoglycan-associated lipoprotein